PRISHNLESWGRRGGLIARRSSYALTACARNLLKRIYFPTSQRTGSSTTARRRLSASPNARGVLAGMIATTLGAESQFFRRWDLRPFKDLPKSASSDAAILKRIGEAIGFLLARVAPSRGRRCAHCLGHLPGPLTGPIYRA